MIESLKNRSVSDTNIVYKVQIKVPVYPEHGNLRLIKGLELPSLTLSLTSDQKRIQTKIQICHYEQSGNDGNR